MRNRICLALLLLAGCSPAPEPTPAPAKPAAASHTTRVLFVEGPPRWEYRYLKEALFRDESVDLQCWLCSADAGFPQEFSNRATDGRLPAPLEHFPDSMEDLLTYDVVILGNVDRGDVPAGTPSLLKAFVAEQGHGLVLIAGEKNMPETWKGTALEDLIPVTRSAEAADSESESAYRVTDAGKNSPLVAFGPDDPLKPWEGGPTGLRPIQWALPSQPRPAARVLVESGPAEHPVPLFVTSTPGKGRVFFSATDETWKWRFGTGDTPWFAPFWRRVIEWARGDP